MYHLDANKTAGEEARRQECVEQYWISPGGNTPQSTTYTATCLPSRKLSKWDEPDTQDTVREAELISDVLLWTPKYGRAKAGRPARTYIQQLCEDTGCSSEDLPEEINDREKWRERVRDICASSTTWWWWLDHGKDTRMTVSYFGNVHRANNNLHNIIQNQHSK